MPDLSIEFFALPDEIVEFVRDWGGSRGIYVTIGGSRKTRQTQVIRSQDFTIDHLVGSDSRFAKVYLTTRKPQVEGSDFHSCNPGSLHLLVGGLGVEGLTLSCLSIRTKLPEALDEGKSFKKYIAKRCSTGVWLGMENTTESKFVRRIHYTTGSKQFFGSGGKLLGMTPSATYSIVAIDGS